ncbi:MAG: lanthionine synthetase C family protein [Psychrobium sp.]|nr:lanthionine synthetase C family protein [Psychrobium sp.]
MPQKIISTNLYVPKIKKILSQLNDKILTNLKNNSTHGLFGGLSGKLLFMYNLHRLDPSLVSETLFSEKLEQLQEQLTEQPFALSNGLAGQVWFLEYLNQHDSDDYDVDLFDDIDKLFDHPLSQRPWNGEIEMVQGLAGYAPYAARRARYSDQTQLYSAIVSGFEDTATYFKNGLITWSQPAESYFRFNKENKQTAEHNLGLAHGVPGIIAALLPALQIPTLQQQVTRLLRGSCDWLLTQRSTINDNEACFGSCSGKRHQSRLGWCYGDLTIALTLARVGKALEQPNYIQQALEIALLSTKRDAASGYVIDAGLCHGFVGLTLIYQLLNKLIPHNKLANAATTWLDYTIAQYDKRGIDAFFSYNGLSEQYEEDCGFLMGYSGIGLALISAVTGDTDWTDSLLMT